jgi:ABC-type ATPase involved in cell division
MSNEVLLETENLVRAFGTFRAVDGLNLQVHAGEMVGLVGPDGAGKTTAIRLMCGALSPTSGTVRVAGYEIPAQVEKAREQIGYLAQRFSLYGDLSVQENIEFFGEVFEVPEEEVKERAASLLNFAGLGDFTDRPAAALSGGMQKKLGLASALIHRPKPGHDNATPSGNGVAAWSLNRLSFLSGETRFRQAAEETLALFWPAIERSPAGFGSLLAALEEMLRPPTTVIVNGPRGEFGPWQEALRGGYRPVSLVLFVPGDATGLPPSLAKPVATSVNAWVCEGVTCLAPITEPGQLRETLKAPKIAGYAPTPNRSA